MDGFDASKDESTPKDVELFNLSTNDWFELSRGACSFSDIAQRQIEQIKKDANCSTEIAAELLTRDVVWLAQALQKIAYHARAEVYQIRRCKGVLND